VRRSARFLSTSLLGLFFGLLFTTGVGSVQTTVAQQPSLNLAQPVQSIKQAALTIDSDARLVDLATAWMKARADTVQNSTRRSSAVAVAPPRDAPAPSQPPTASIDEDLSTVRVKPVQTRDRGSEDKRIRTENTESPLAQEKRRSRTVESDPRTVSASDRPEQSPSRPAVDDSKAQNESSPPLPEQLGAATQTEAGRRSGGVGEQLIQLSTPSSESRKPGAGEHAGSSAASPRNL